MKEKVVSFDLDGTLTDYSFTSGVWEEGIPLEFARKNSISFEEARAYCRQCYDTVGEVSIKWYLVDYWLDYLGLSHISINSLIEPYMNRINLFMDAEPVLKKLKSNNRKLVMFSNASRCFLDAEVKDTGIEKYFDRIISLPDDWGMVKSDKEAFSKLESMIGHFVHVGDSVACDYESPKRAGIESYHVFRGIGKKLPDSFITLKEIPF